MNTACPSVLAAIELCRRRRLARGHAATLANVEDFRIVLKPVQVSSQFLGDITLATSRKADHDNDQLCTDIALGNAAVGRDLRLGQAGDIKCSCSNSIWSVGLRTAEPAIEKQSQSKLRTINSRDRRICSKPSTSQRRSPHASPVSTSHRSGEKHETRLDSGKARDSHLWRRGRGRNRSVCQGGPDSALGRL